MNPVLAAVLLGLLTAASPCLLPLYPGFLAYLASQREVGTKRYLLGLFVLAGVLTMMLALGGLMALLSVSVGSVLAYIIPLSDLLIFSLGLLLLLGRNPFVLLPQIQAPVLSHPYANAYLYGLLYGPIALPCSGPMVVSIFALSLTLGEALQQIWVFLWFGLGLGLPMLALSFFSLVLQRRLMAFVVRHERFTHVVGGLLLVSIALYDLVRNWQMLQLFLGL